MAWLGFPDYLQEPSFQFWALQGIGWGGWATSWIASGVFWGMQPAYNLAVLVSMVTGMLLTAILREIYQAFWNHPVWLRALPGLVGSYFVAGLWQLSKNVALFEFYGPLLELDEQVAQGFGADFRGTLSLFDIVLCWSGLYFGIKYFRMLLIERARALTAIASARSPATHVALSAQSTLSVQYPECDFHPDSRTGQSQGWPHGQSAREFPALLTGQ